MALDFTITAYRQLIEALIAANYQFITYEHYCREVPEYKFVILRHDIDARPNHALQFAEIQHEYGIVGSYYFRMIANSWQLPIVEKIKSLGHEIGYHYENLTTKKGDVGEAYSDFVQNLEIMRNVASISTICMHGSPMSKHDSKDIWKKYDYKKLKIIGEPYFDTDFSKMLYLTDTGRKWNGDKVSVRDKVDSPYKFDLKSTEDVIKNIPLFPNQIMFTFHPQRWSNSPLIWMQEIILQRTKNVVKQLFFVRK